MNTEIFFALGVVVVTATAFAVLGKLLRLPSLAAFLLAGLVLGPVCGMQGESPAIALLSELGIVLLLFIVGMELSFDKVRDVGKVAIGAGLAQVVLTASAGFGLCVAMGFGTTDAVFLGLALTFSSTVVVVKVLSDKDELDGLYGRIAVGILLVQDLAVIIVLTVLSGLRAGGYDGAALGLGILKAFGGMLLLLGGVLLTSRFVLPAIFEWASRSAATIFIWSLFWCFAVVAVAEHLGLSMELGAFFAGLSLAQLPFNKDLQYRIKPLMTFFVAVFFVSLGLTMTPGSLTLHWWQMALLVLFVIVGKPLILMAVIPRFGYGRETSFLTSTTLAPVSEFSFIFVAMGASAGLVQAGVVTATGMTGIASIAISAYVILANRRVYAAWNRLGVLDIFGAKDLPEPIKPEPRSGHVIVVGMNTLGRKLAIALSEKGETVVAVDTDPFKLRGLPCLTHLGNVEFRDVLSALALPRARLLVSALQIEEANDLLAYRCQCCGVPAAIHAIDMSVVDNLLELGVDYLMLPKVDGVKLQTEVLHNQGVI